ncbi:MAG: T9SS type A sorting domain-containing protein [Bacteroidales bacterium]|nr:T9SS type A sorting domain-containing protein [Bacteroidales bacterium]
MTKSTGIKWILFAIFLYSIKIYGQNSLNSSGRSNTIDNVCIEWTLGETITGTLKSGNSIVTQGVNQPGIIVHSTLPYSTDSLFKVFPNPVNEYISIACEKHIPSFLCLVYDCTGKLIQEYQITGNRANIQMQNYAAGYYLLKIIHQDNQPESFEIIVNK